MIVKDAQQTVQYMIVKELHWILTTNCTIIVKELHWVLTTNCTVYDCERYTTTCTIYDCERGTLGTHNKLYNNCERAVLDTHNKPYIISKLITVFSSQITITVLQGVHNTTKLAMVIYKFANQGSHFRFSTPGPAIFWI